jgi:flagellar hook-associated protein FlgK
METEDEFRSLLAEHVHQDHARLDRIEEKIDKLAEFVVALARVEEQINDLQESRDKIEVKLSEVEIMQRIAQRDLDSHDQILKSITKVLWILAAAAITGGISAGLLLITG